MEQTLSLGCLVMAAGSGRRFGGNKLAAELDGKTLMCWETIRKVSPRPLFLWRLDTVSFSEGEKEMGSKISFF